MYKRWYIVGPIFDNNIHLIWFGSKKANESLLYRHYPGNMETEVPQSTMLTVWNVEKVIFSGG